MENVASGGNVQVFDENCGGVVELYLPFDGRFVNRPYTAPNNVTDTVVGDDAYVVPFLPQ